MLETTSYGPVTRFDLGRTLFGRGRYWTSAYLVDGLLVDTGLKFPNLELMFCYNPDMAKLPPLRQGLSRLWDRLLKALGLTSVDRRTYTFEGDLVKSLEDLAEQEQRPEDEVAADLLAFALAQRDAVESYYERWQELSPREQQIAALSCLNYTNRQIAARLKISPETVKTHVRNMLGKFGLHSKAELRQALADWDFSAWEAANF